MEIKSIFKKLHDNIYKLVLKQWARIYWYKNLSAYIQILQIMIVNNMRLLLMGFGHLSLLSSLE